MRGVRRLLTRPVRAVLDRLGYTIVPKRAAPAAPAVTPLAIPTDAIYAQSDIVFEVPLAKCTYPYLLSYGPDGWHPFVDTLREYGSGAHTRYEGSVLNRYYEKFQPRTHLDVFFADVDKDEALLRSRLSQFAADRYAPFLPWDLGVIPIRGEKGLDASHGIQAYGPVSDAKGRLEYARLTETYRSIRTRGYRVTAAPDAEIRGYFLRGEEDYRFIVDAGLHRMAVLAALGYDPVRVKFYPHHPRTIDLADLGNWPQVKAGVVEAQVARHLFQRFFADGGKARARSLGLLPTSGG